MKIAYFSPLPPLKSGISDYSELMLIALMKHATIDVWVEGFVPTSEFINENFGVYDYVSHPELLLQLKDYDEVIFNIGNNPYYHTQMYDVFLKYNGIVILHEYVLYYLVTGYLLDYNHDSDKYLQELKMNHGDKGYTEGLKILRSEIPPLQYKTPEKLPLNKSLIDHAKGIIVHSEFARSEVLKVNPLANCVTINQIGPNPDEVCPNKQRVKQLKNKYGIKDDDLLIASFGYVSSTKRIHQVIKALSTMKTESNYKYILVGEGDYVKEVIKKYKLSDKVIFTGFTSIEEFDELIAVSDIVINLRYPYMGETSASLIRTLLLGKASLVSAIGWFNELPDDVAIKVPVNESEVSAIKSALELLINNIETRKKYEQAALLYAKNNLSPDSISKNVIEYVDMLNKEDIQEKVIFSLCDRVCEILDYLDVIKYDDYIARVSRVIHEIS